MPICSFFVWRFCIVTVFRLSAEVPSLFSFPPSHFPSFSTFPSPIQSLSWPWSSSPSCRSTQLTQRVWAESGCQMYFGALLADKYAFGATVVFTRFNPLVGIKTAEQRIQQYGDWYTCRQWTGCYIWYSEEGPGRAATPPSPLLTVPNVTAHPSMTSVPIWCVTIITCVH